MVHGHLFIFSRAIFSVHWHFFLFTYSVFFTCLTYGCLLKQFPFQGTNENNGLLGAKVGLLSEKRRRFEELWFYHPASNLRTVSVSRRNSDEQKKQPKISQTNVTFVLSTLTCGCPHLKGGKTQLTCTFLSKLFTGTFSRFTEKKKKTGFVWKGRKWLGKL